MNPWERDWSQPAPGEAAAPWNRNWDAPDVGKHDPVKATDGMSGMDRFLAGAGKGFTDVGRGIGQRFRATMGVYGGDRGRAAADSLGLATEADVAEARKRDAPLMDTGAGVFGNVVGSVASLAPAMFVPGANTVAGASAIGALSGAARPTVEGESVAGNIATDALLAGGSQWGLGKIVGGFDRRLAGLKEKGLALAAQNKARDETVRELTEAGYSVLPSVSGGSVVGRTMESIGGKAKTAQQASVKHQPVTDAIIKKTLGLADDAPITRETVRGARMEAIETGYTPVRELPFMETDDAYRRAISSLTSRADNAAKDFGDVVTSDVKPLTEGLLKVKGFSGDSAIDAVSTFREKASDLYGAGNKTLATAYRKAAEAVEDQIERALPDGSDLLKNYRAARVKVAQTFDVEKAVREGHGVVDARVIGKLYAKAPERMSGGMATVGRAANLMPESMTVPKAGWDSPVTGVDSNLGLLGGVVSGSPLPLAWPLARQGARQALLSKPGQRALGSPNYGPGAVDAFPAALMKALQQRAAGAGMGSIYAAEE